MADVGKATIVFELKVDLPRIQEAVEKVRAALAEFRESALVFDAAMTERSAFGIGPVVGSLWVLRNGQDGLWRVEDNPDKSEHPFQVHVVGASGQDETRDCSVAEFERMFTELSDRVPLAEAPGTVWVPAPLSLWEFADDRDPGGIWRVAGDYRGGADVLELRRIDGPPAQNGDVSATWRGTVANHNKTFRRSNG